MQFRNILVFLFVVGVTASASFAFEPLFDTRVDYQVGARPEQICSADFDRDGGPDLAVANPGSNSISILRNNGNATFASAINYGVGNGPASVAVADMNGDGWPDLAIANRGTAPNWNSNFVSIMMNNGDGTFAPAVNYWAGYELVSVAVADLDGDGKPDLAVAGVDSSSITILRNFGDGTFTSAVSYMTGVSPRWVCVADLNSDGSPDLAVANGSGTVSILMNDGNAAFSTAVSYTVGGNPQTVFAADFDGNGALDLAVANYASKNVSVMNNLGDGTFASLTNYNLSGNPRSVIAVDIDGDAKHDLAVVNGGGLSTLLNNGDGTFSGEVKNELGYDPYFVCSADLDRDGDLDLAATNHGGNNISVMRNFGDGTFPSALRYGVGASVIAIVAADFDGDGKSDLALANGNSSPYLTVSVLKNNGDATFSNPVNYSINQWAQSIAAADFDGDGHPDLAAIGKPSTSNYVAILRNNGNGAFTNAVQYALGMDPNFVCAADFSGDARPDLAVSMMGSNSVAILINRGNGTFENPITFGVGGIPKSITAADFDGSGFVDLAVTISGSNYISILKNNGNGTFAPAVKYGNSGYNTQSAFAADFDGDDKPDLAIAATNYNEVSILKNNGDGSFASPVSYVTGWVPCSVFAADFDQDGKLDLAVANSWGNSVSILKNDGDGTFADAVSYGGDGDYPQSIVATDFDGDMRPDIAMVGGNRNAVLVLLNRSSGTLSFCQSVVGLFCDDFEISGNPEWVNSEGGCAWQVINGNYHTSLNGSQLSCVQSIGDDSWRNYVLDCEVNGIAGSDKIVRFRQTGNDRYFVNLRSQQSDLTLGKYSGGVETILATVPYSNQNDVWYHIRVTCVDEHLTVQINGQQLISVDDNTSPLYSGGIGLVCYTGETGVNDIQFDNVAVTDPYPHIDLSDNSSVFEIGDNISLTGSIRYFDGSPYPVQSGNFAVENPVKKISEIVSVAGEGSFQYSVSPPAGGEPGTYALTFGISTPGGIARNHFALAINDVVTSQYPNTPGMIGKIEIRTDVEIELGDHETIPPQPDWAAFSKGPFGGYWTQAFAPATSGIWNATKDIYKEASSFVIGGVKRTTESATGKLAVEMMNSGTRDCLFGGLQRPKCALAIGGVYSYGTSAFANTFTSAFHKLVDYASDPEDPILYPNETAWAHQAVDFGGVILSVIALKPYETGFTAASKFVVDAGILSIDYIELIHKYLPAPAPNKSISSSSLMDVSFIAHDTSGLILAIGIEPRIENMCIVQSFSPVKLIVTDPRGRTVSWDTSEIPGSRYYRLDSDSDGDSSTLVLVPLDTVGNVLIDIVADAGADPMDLFTVIADNTYFQEPIVIANNLPISQLPVNPVPIQTFENLGPAASTLNTPAGSTFIGYPANLTWSPSVDPNPGHIVSYDVIVAKQADFSDSVVESAGAVTSFDFHSWMHAKVATVDTSTYYWRVFAHDDWGAGSMSASSTFEVAYCCHNVTGNVNDIGIVDLSDLSALVSYLTGGGYALPCVLEANVNGSGIVDLSDLSALVSYLTGGGFVLPVCP